MGLWVKNPAADRDEILAQILELADLARKESILALEKTGKLNFEPLKNAVKMAVDRTDPGVLTETLETQAHFEMEEGEVFVKFWEDFGAIAPTIGILGAVIGLMVVMNVLDEPEKIGPGISVAFVATLYGVGLANIFGIPIGKKIKRKLILQNYAYEMVIIGIEGILSGLNPKVIEEKLKVFTNNSVKGVAEALAKKQKCPEFENHERWLVSFADMMTLLFAVFVVLYALKDSGAKDADVEQATESIKRGIQ